MHRTYPFSNIYQIRKDQNSHGFLLIIKGFALYLSTILTIAPLSYILHVIHYLLPTTGLPIYLLTHSLLQPIH
ncbi:hypothetical protein F4809DRAFT_141025 [Biscogniauxia mediterranea]|nr:hypothetical protein F4809DRAFT_141025 [Biscogniauxia mediterranea]